MIAIVIYLPAIWIDPEFLILAANCALIAFLLLEVKCSFDFFNENINEKF